MRRFIWASVYIAGGIAAGCFSAFAVIQSAGVEEVEPGLPWLSRAEALADKEDFYARAHYLLSGRLPPAAGQITEAVAETDSKGNPLTGSCVYRIASTGPLPRWWSIGIIGGGGDGSPLQSTVDSASVIGRPDGGVEIAAYPSPRPGNWLQSPTLRRFSVIYSALPRGPDAAAPPFTITAEDCL